MNVAESSDDKDTMWAVVYYHGRPVPVKVPRSVVLENYAALPPLTESSDRKEMRVMEEMHPAVTAYGTFLRERASLEEADSRSDPSPQTVLTVAEVIAIVNAAPKADSATGFDLVHREDILRKLPR